MLEAELLGAAAQTGVVGLLAWMWLLERRAAAARELELAELHERVLSDRVKLDVLVGVVTSNTRALTALESVQRVLVSRLCPGAGSGEAA